MTEKTLELRVDDWLDSVRISLLSEWDVLMFLYRHETSLASAGQIAILLGYAKGDVGNALDNLGALGLVQRSRSSQGVRLYRFEPPANLPCQQSLGELLKLSEQRSGRLIVARRLGERERVMRLPTRDGLYLA